MQCRITSYKCTRWKPNVPIAKQCPDSAQYIKMGITIDKISGGQRPLPMQCFFSSRTADHALRLGPYMRRSSLRKLLHGHSSEANHQSQNTNHQKQKARRRSPSQICVSPSKGQQSKQRTGQEPNRNNHKKFAKDTVVKTHCVATDSKTCSKRISCHPVK